MFTIVPASLSAFALHALTTCHMRAQRSLLQLVAGCGCSIREGCFYGTNLYMHGRPC